MKGAIYFGIVFLSGMFSHTDSVHLNKPAIKLTYLSQQAGKPPLRFYYFDLFIENNTDSVQWYLFPYHGEDTLKYTALNGFKADAPGSEPFGGKKFPDSVECKNKIVEINFFGIYQGSFNAFCLKQHTAINLRNFTMNADRNFTHLEIWEAGKILVNGKIPLENWLPYDVFSTNRTGINSDGSWHNLDWDYKTNSSRKNYPKEKVEFVSVGGVKKHSIDFTRKIMVTRADSLLVELNRAQSEGGDELHESYRKEPGAAEKFQELERQLQNLGIKYEWKSNNYHLSDYNVWKMLDELNYLVNAAGDVHHQPQGMASTGESIVMFENLEETLHAYGIAYKWDEKAKKYVLK